MRLSSQQVSAIFWALSVAVAAIALLLPVAANDFDSHHDGIMLAAAVAIRDGAIVQREVFAQYGPITPIVQALALEFGGAPALTLRLLNVLLLTSTAVLLSLIPTIRGTYTIPTTAFRWGALIWVLAYVPMLQSAMLPWSSVVSQFLMVVALFLMAWAWRTSGAPSVVLSIFAGIVGGLMPFARLNSGAVFISLFGVVVLLALLARRPLTHLSRSVLMFAAGAIGASLTILAIMIIQGSLRAYYMQALYFPAHQQSEAAEQADPVSQFLWMTWSFLPSLMVVLGGVAFLAAVKRWRPVFVLRFRLIAYVTSIVVLLLNIFVVGGRPSSLPGLTGLPILELLFVMGVWSLTGLGVASLVKWRKSPALALATAFFVASGLAPLAQGVPLFDSRHLWWGLPLGVVAAVALAGNLRPQNSRLPNSFAIACLVILLFMFVAEARVTDPFRLELKSPALVAGMRVSPEQASSLVDDAALLQRVPQDARPLFFVADGDVSVLSDTYRASDSYFVWWGFPPRPLPDRLNEVNYVVAQIPPNGDRLILEQFPDDFVEVGSTRRLVLLERVVR